jgi:uncharacterized coiled-coil DUF342 family protein
MKQSKASVGKNVQRHDTPNREQAAEGLGSIAKKLTRGKPLTVDEKALLCEVLFWTEQRLGLSSGGCKKPPSS